MKIPSLKELIYVVSTLISMGIVWGSLKTKVDAQEIAIKELKPANERLAVVETKIDLLLRHFKLLHSE